MTDPVIAVRFAGAPDVPNLAQLNTQVQGWHANVYPEYFNTPVGPSVFEPFWRDMIASPVHDVLLAEQSTKTVGYALVEHQTREKTAFMRPINRLYLHHIHVDEQNRRAGVGRALMEKIEYLAGGATGIGLDTWQLNIAAQAFFRASGFETQRLLMNKKLAEPAPC